MTAMTRVIRMPVFSEMSGFAFLIRSLNATVAVPMISLDAVDMTAASAAAIMTPLTPIGVMVATGLAIALGDKWVLLDPIVACIISLVVLVPAIKVLIIACKDLLDVSVCPEEETQIVQTLESLQAAKPNADAASNAGTSADAASNAETTADAAGLKVLQLKTRRSGPTLFIEATLAAQANLSLSQADALRTQAETALQQQFGPDTCLTLVFRAMN